MINDKSRLTSVLLACGVGAAAVYLTMDVLASALYEGYSYRDQTLSELSASGAPTRPLAVFLSLVYSVLRVGFAVGIWRTAAPSKRLQVVAGCVAIVGLLGLTLWPFAPIEQRDVGAPGKTTGSEALHVALVGADALLFLIAAGAGSTAFGTRFRYYSIATILVFLLAGAVSAGQSSGIGQGEPTPWLGIWERIAVYAAVAWTVVLAVCLWRAPRERQEVTPS